jgi:hypothetical protein
LTATAAAATLGPTTCSETDHVADAVAVKVHDHDHDRLIVRPAD